jgi:hypothetical protein
MQTRAVVLLAVVAAAAAGAWYVTQQRAPAPERAAPPPAVAATPPHATQTPTVARAPLPPADAPHASTDTALRERASGGDGAAPWRWYREQADCRRWREWSAAPEGFARKLIDAAAAAGNQPPFFAMPPDELEAFRNPANSAEIAAANAQNLMERLETLCAGSQDATDDEVYRIALAAALSGPTQAKWQFIDTPPADLAANDARRRDWSARALGIAQAQLAEGDAEAAFALGVAYAKDDYDERRRGAVTRNAFNASLANDPKRAYELLWLYLSTQPDPARLERTQQLLAELRDALTDDERGAAQAAADKLRLEYFSGRDN